MLWCVAGYFSQIPAVSEWVMCQWGDVVCCRLFLSDPSSFRMRDVSLRWWCVASYFSQIPAVSEWLNESCVHEVMRWCVAGYFSQVPAVSEWVMCQWGDEVVCCRLFLTDPKFQNEWCVDEVMRCVAGYFSRISTVSEWVMCQWGDVVVCCRPDPSSFRMSHVLWWYAAGYISQISAVSEWVMY